MEINVVSETLTMHEYESKTLAKAFEEITGIKVKHDIIQEGDVVEKMQTQMQSGKNVYDGWINDSDFIGTHFRYGQAVDLTDWMAGEGKDVTDPDARRQRLHRQVVHHGARTASSTSCPTSSSPTCTGSATTGSPIPDYKAKFKAKYGYDLGVPRELVGLRGHRRVLHQRRQGNRRQAGLWPHGLRQEGPVAGLALHRRLAVDGRQRRQGPSERPAGRRMGHPHGRLPPVGSSRRAWRRRQRPGGGLFDRRSTSTG